MAVCYVEGASTRSAMVVRMHMSFSNRSTVISAKRIHPPILLVFPRMITLRMELMPMEMEPMQMETEFIQMETELTRMEMKFIQMESSQTAARQTDI